MRHKLTLLGAFVATGALMAGGAEAQSVLFTGYTNGCFNCVAPTSSDGYQQENLAGLTYENAGFTATTIDGFTGVGSSTNPLGPPRNEDNFGGMYLDPNVDYDYGDDTFSLLITFLEPSSNSALFTASLRGRVVDNDGGPEIDFDNDFQYWFANGFKYGVRVHDRALHANGGTDLTSVPITGVLTAEVAVPEPMSMILMSTGLFGVAFVGRRRRNQLEDDDG